MTMTTPHFVLIGVIAVELVVVVIGLVAILYLRWRQHRRERWEERLATEATDWLNHAVSTRAHENPTEAPPLLHLPTAPTWLARGVLVELGDRLQREEREHLGELWKHLSPLVPDAPTRGERLQQVRVARALWDPKDRLNDLVRDADPDVALAAWETLALLGRFDDALQTLPLIAAEGRLHRLRAEDALVAARPEPARLLSPLKAADPRSKEVLLVVLGRLNAIAEVMDIANYLRDDDEVVRLQAVRALGLIGDPIAFSSVQHALQDEAWIVRSEAARAVAVLGGAGAVPYLVSMLDDDAEWVRHNAALALARCGKKGHAALLEAAKDGSVAAGAAWADLNLDQTNAQSPTRGEGGAG